MSDENTPHIRPSVPGADPWASDDDLEVHASFNVPPMMFWACWLGLILVVGVVIFALAMSTGEPTAPACGSVLPTPIVFPRP